MVPTFIQFYFLLHFISAIVQFNNLIFILVISFVHSIMVSTSSYFVSNHHTLIPFRLNISYHYRQFLHIRCLVSPYDRWVMQFPDCVSQLWDCHFFIVLLWSRMKFTQLAVLGKDRFWKRAFLVKHVPSFLGGI